MLYEYSTKQMATTCTCTYCSDIRVLYEYSTVLVRGMSAVVARESSRMREGRRRSHAIESTIVKESSAPTHRFREYLYRTYRLTRHCIARIITR